MPWKRKGTIWRGHYETKTNETVLVSIGLQRSNSWLRTLSSQTQCPESRFWNKNRYDLTWYPGNIWSDDTTINTPLLNTLGGKCFRRMLFYSISINFLGVRVHSLSAVHPRSLGSLTVKSNTLLRSQVACSRSAVFSFPSAHENTITCSWNVLP